MFTRALTLFRPTGEQELALIREIEVALAFQKR
jgi:hypothetical protein